ncbi:MAG: M61 family metallopeptidase [Gemmatimonadota bacterium]|nr:MAG: M61 family metallopeptidase [Gemmatimonadota bacterium]
MDLARAGFVALALLASAVGGWAQEPIRYLVRVDDASSRLYHVEAELPATGDVTLVSLPSWTPGHYKVENYARNVRHFEASAGDESLRWDKLDKDTWRVHSEGARKIRVSFDYFAGTLELSQSLLRSDFGFLNGTNLFVFPESGFDFPAQVSFDLPESWKVATEMEEAGEPGVYRASDYHDLVDNPTFVGHFAIDSVNVDGRWSRLAVYPAAHFRDPARGMALEALGKIATTLHEMFGEVPYRRYTTFIYLADENYLYVAGLEHSNSQFDIMPAIIFDQARFTFRELVYPLLSHEYYHAWNVKRIRPTALWPYAYDREQFTELLWVSEGITDYYANVVLVRAGIWNDRQFWEATRSLIASVEVQPVHEAVEDASLNTWLEPTYVDQYYYYDKGALLGLLLDIQIRHATENQHSLDDVMTRLYREHYLKGGGFTTEDFIGYVGEFIGQEGASRFYRDYVDGRLPLPYRETLALAGMDFRTDTIVEPFFGVQLASQRRGRMVVRQVVPGSPAARAGLRVGDELKWVGDVEVNDGDWTDEFHELYAESIGEPITIVHRRGGEDVRKTVKVGERTRYEHRLEPMAEASAGQIALRRGILERGSSQLIDE